MFEYKFYLLLLIDVRIFLFWKTYVTLILSLFGNFWFHVWQEIINLINFYCWTLWFQYFRPYCRSYFDNIYQLVRHFVHDMIYADIYLLSNERFVHYHRLVRCINSGCWDSLCGKCTNDSHSWDHLVFDRTILISWFY